MRLIILGIIALGIAACAVDRSAHHSSSVVQYLYPDKPEQVETERVPHLRLPLRVGIAFVPEATVAANEVINEERKLHLMENVKEHFSQYDFVRHIEVIPSAYLQPRGSFANLDQLKTMFGLDVVALISYDQSRFTGEGAASITYWTLIGAYIVPGEKNDTHTMVDAAVYDIASRSLLFRAPGVSHIHSSATPVNLSEQVRLDAQRGFDEASASLIVALDKKLQEFRQRVKESPEAYQVERREGYGGGAMGVFDLMIVLAIAGLVLFRRKI